MDKFIVFNVVGRENPEKAALEAHGKHQELTIQKTREKSMEKIIDRLRRKQEITIEQLANSLGLAIKGIDWQITNLKKVTVSAVSVLNKGGH